MASILNKILGRFGYQLIPADKNNELPTDFDHIHQSIWKKVHPFTMTSPERIYSLIESVRYTERAFIEGDIVECGVWKGGSMMAIIQTLLLKNNQDRNLYLYDTYEGMSEPSEHDVDFSAQAASAQLSERTRDEKDVIWAYSPLEAVQQNIYSTGYPKEKIHFIKGKVEDTIPKTIPEKISLLRLDTDWYESTRHELIHLFPLLSKGGVLIIDDYGHWAGARKAVDEFFEQQQLSGMLHRIDNTGRIYIKQ
jgi:hypothetical protein